MLHARLLHLAPLILLIACTSAPPAAAPGSAAPRPGPAKVQLGALDAIWRERMTSTIRSDFFVGPGDVIEVTVVDLPELQSHKVRVSSKGSISLPLVGTVPAAGLSEEQLADAISDRLDGDIMYDPSVSVFVAEYRSRAVGVIGAVATPGFYDLASDHDTILDAISMAGGMSDKAAPRIFFVPAPTGAPSASPAPDVSSSPPSPESEAALVLDFEAGRSRYLAIPLRPGDVLIVAERGHVLVNGWVKEPGSYAISPDLSLLGAITAAGGLRYAADRSSVDLIRAEGGPTERFDFLKLQRGEQRDVLVRSGDIIAVSHITSKVVVSSFMEFLTRVLSVGAHY